MDEVSGNEEMRLTPERLEKIIEQLREPQFFGWPQELLNEVYALRKENRELKKMNDFLLKAMDTLMKVTKGLLK